MLECLSEEVKIRNTSRSKTQKTPDIPIPEDGVFFPLSYPGIPGFLSFTRTLKHSGTQYLLPSLPRPDGLHPGREAEACPALPRASQSGDRILIWSSVQGITSGRPSPGPRGIQPRPTRLFNLSGSLARATHQVALWLACSWVLGVGTLMAPASPNCAAIALRVGRSS